MRYSRDDLGKMVDSFLGFVDQSIFSFIIEGFDYRSQEPDLKLRASEKRGVYALSWKGGRIAYIGLAMATFTTRVFAHFDKLPQDELEFVDLIYWDSSSNRRERGFMFPALEYYLISNTSPELNGTYSYYGEGLVVMEDDCKHYGWFEDP